MEPPLENDCIHSRKRRTISAGSLQQAIERTSNNFATCTLSQRIIAKLLSLKTGDLQKFNYVGEMMLWTGLSLNTLNSGAVESKAELCYMLSPLCFLVPYFFFD